MSANGYVVTADYIKVTSAKGRETRIPRGGKVAASAMSAATAAALVAQGVIAPLPAAMPSAE
jgi:hypothetical protein